METVKQTQANFYGCCFIFMIIVINHKIWVELLHEKLLILIGDYEKIPGLMRGWAGAELESERWPRCTEY